MEAHSGVDVIEYGTYVTRVATNPLTIRDRKGRPVLVRPDWPIMVQDDTGVPVPDARFMVSVARREEKGSDVNVAAHLLLDVCSSSGSTPPSSSATTATWRFPSAKPATECPWD